MQRLHEDDLVGHVLGMEPWNVIRLPAIAEENESHVIQTPYGERRFERRSGYALHPDRELLEFLNRIREAEVECNCAGQSKHATDPVDGASVIAQWSMIIS